jgi:uncharacterized protein
MDAFFFGPPERRLFGTFHPARGGAARSEGLLLCNPFGQEAVRVHRLYRVIAERLTRSGFDVMRFDYFGTGDSAGADAEGELEGWARDLIAAGDELTRRARPQSTTWLGARLGAAVAVNAAAAAARAPDKLILWEPVFDGAGYVQTLRRAHVEALENTYVFHDPAWRLMLENDSPELDREGVGFELGPALLGQLQALDAATAPVPRAARCVVVSMRRGPEVSAVPAHLRERWERSGHRIEQIVLDQDFEWLAEEIADGMLVPADLLMHLTQAVAGPA